jgi:hypothetical protein
VQSGAESCPLSPFVACEGKEAESMVKKILVCLALAAVGLLTFSLSRGQDRQPAQQPAGPSAAVSTPRADAAAPAGSVVHDFSHLNDLQKQMPLCARRGAEWLFRMNETKGRFVYGYVPALRVPLDGDHFLCQAGAAFALARSARFTGEERYAARATQAALALFEETAADKENPQIRYTTLPPSAINRLGAAGVLVLAVHELPSPQADLLDKSEQLCNYIRARARTDGSLACAEPADDGKVAADDVDAMLTHPGVALYALVRSYEHRPAPWKLEVARKAVTYYRAWFKTHKDPRFVPWQTAACSELFARAKDAECAEFVTEMNDFLCGLQYDQIDPRRQLWYGGFMGWADGRPIETAPNVGSAAYAESLAAACRVVREQGDVARYERYSGAFERCFQFLVTLQYNDSNTDHFAPWYRERIIGGFHVSHQDGNLRIDYTQHAVSAVVQYLEAVAK